jgi:hypothetical protein
VIRGPVNRTAAARSRLRASDADREQAVEELKVAFAHGRLTKDELDLRVGLAFVSRTYADLAAVVADIPAGPVPATPLRPARTRVRPPAGTAVQPPANRAVTPPADMAVQSPPNSKVYSLGFAVATMVLPAVIAAVLLSSGQGLFSAIVAALPAYALALLMGAAWLPRAPRTAPPVRSAGSYRRGQRRS